MSPHDDKFLQEQLNEVKECVQMTDNCDKGPLIQQAIDKIDVHIVDSQEFRQEFRAAQKDLTSAVIDLARSQEKLIAINNQTEHHHTAIEKLFDVNRETDQRITDHLIKDHSYKHEAPAADKPDSTTVTKASRYDKMTWMLITAAATWLVTLAYNGFIKLIEALNTLGG